MKILYKKYIDLILEKPKTFIVLSIFLAGLVSISLMKFESSFSNRIWFNEKHEVSLKLDEYERIFHNIDSLVIGIERRDKSDLVSNFSQIEELANLLESVKYVSSVEAIPRAVSISSKEDDIYIKEILSLEEEEKLESLKNQGDDFRHLLNKEHTVGQILIRFSSESDLSEEYELILDQIKKIILKYDDYKFYIIGSVASNTAFKELALNDNLLIPVSAVLIVLFLYFFFKSVVIVFLPIFLSVMVINITISLMAFSDIPYNNILAAIPGILLAICLADSIHIMSSLYLKLRTQSFLNSLRESMIENFIPTLLTTISTIISFISIAQTEIEPIQHLGYLVSLGTFVAWIYTYTLLAPLLLVLEKFVKVEKKEEKKFGSLLSFVVRFKKVVCFSFFLLISFSFYFSSKLKVDSDPISYFKESNKFRSDLEHLTEKMDIQRTVDLVVDLKKGDSISNIKNIEKLRKLVTYIEKKDKVSSVTSLLDVVRKMNKVLRNSDSLPTKTKEISEMLFLYELSASSENNLELFDFSKRYLKVRVFWNIKNSSESADEIDDIQKFSSKIGLDVFPGGDFVIFISIVQKIVETLISSLLTAVIFVFFLVLFIFKDLKIALIAMLPNVVPISFAGFLIYHSGFFLDIGTSMIATITLGIAIDDTIHFISKYVDGKRKYNDNYLAVEYAFENCASALIQTTVVLFFGFGIFIFAEFLPNRNFGFFTSVCIVMALLTDLLLLPAILLFFHTNSKRPSKV